MIIDQLSLSNISSGNYFTEDQFNQIVDKINELITQTNLSYIYRVDITENMLSNYSSPVDLAAYLIMSKSASGENAHTRVIVTNKTAKDIYLTFPNNVYNFYSFGANNLYLPASTVNNYYFNFVDVYKPNLTTTPYIAYFKNKYSPINYVNLGLPSGTMWADKNFGARQTALEVNTTDTGTFSLWSLLTAASYELSLNIGNWSGSGTIIYRAPSGYNYKTNSDNLKKLKVNDDIVYVATNGIGCIPTNEQWEELYKYTNRTIVQSSSAYLYLKFTSKVNSNYITFWIHSSLSYVKCTSDSAGESYTLSRFASGGLYYWTSNIPTDLSTMNKTLYIVGADRAMGGEESTSPATGTCHITDLCVIRPVLYNSAII